MFSKCVKSMTVGPHWNLEFKFRNTHFSDSAFQSQRAMIYIILLRVYK